MLSILSFAHVLVGEPASTSPEHALGPRLQTDGKLAPRLAAELAGRRSPALAPGALRDVSARP